MTGSFYLSLLRSLILAAFTLQTARIIFAYYSQCRAKMKIAIFLLALSPLVIPPLVPAYAYSAFRVNFQTAILLNELCYGLILVARCLPFSFIILYLLNYHSRSTANTCCDLSPQKVIPLKIKHRSLIIAFLINALIIFHDYEIASLMRIKHWSIDVFNAHAGGLSQTIGNSMLMISKPLIFSILLMLTVFCFNRLPAIQSLGDENKLLQPTRKFLAPSLLALLLGISCAIPLIVILCGAQGAFKEIFSSHWMVNETFNSLTFALIATSCAAMLTHFLANLKNKGLALFVIPGLCGPLILGLLILSSFSFTPSLSKGVLPLAIALILYALPLSFLMRFILLKHNKESAILSATLLPAAQQQRITWRLKTLPFVLSQFPIFCWLWFDLTLNTLLAPTAMPGLFPRLYNLMHYNENQKLSATVVVAVLIPPLILAMVILISRTGTLWKKSKSSGN